MAGEPTKAWIGVTPEIVETLHVCNLFVDGSAVQHYASVRFDSDWAGQMASYLLYIVTGAALALMAARHLIVLRRAPPPANHSTLRLNILQAMEGKGLHWAEAALCGAIFLFGFGVMLTAGLLFIAGLLHSF
jgi:hypothetical protein